MPIQDYLALNGWPSPEMERPDIPGFGTGPESIREDALTDGGAQRTLSIDHGAQLRGSLRGYCGRCLRTDQRDSCDRPAKRSGCRARREERLSAAELAGKEEESRKAALAAKTVLDLTAPVTESAPPEWATAAIMAEYRRKIPAARLMRRPVEHVRHGSRRVARPAKYETILRVLTGWRRGKRDDFRQFRDAARNFPPTSGLASSPVQCEHRETYAGGSGRFLNENPDSGWAVTPGPIENCDSSVRVFPLPNVS